MSISLFNTKAAKDLFGETHLQNEHTNNPTLQANCPTFDLINQYEQFLLSAADIIGDISTSQQPNAATVGAILDDICAAYVCISRDQQTIDHVTVNGVVSASRLNINTMTAFPLNHGMIFPGYVSRSNMCLSSLNHQLTCGTWMQVAGASVKSADVMAGSPIIGVVTSVQSTNAYTVQTYGNCQLPLPVSPNSYVLYLSATGQVSGTIQGLPICFAAGSTALLSPVYSLFGNPQLACQYDRSEYGYARIASITGGVVAYAAAPDRFTAHRIDAAHYSMSAQQLVYKDGHVKTPLFDHGIYEHRTQKLLTGPGHILAPTTTVLVDGIQTEVSYTDVVDSVESMTPDGASTFRFPLYRHAAPMALSNVSMYAAPSRGEWRMTRAVVTSGYITLSDEWAALADSCIYYIGAYAYTTSKNMSNPNHIYIDVPIGGGQAAANGDVVTVVFASATGCACYDASVGAQHIAADSIDLSHLSATGSIRLQQKRLTDLAARAADAASILANLT